MYSRRFNQLTFECLASWLAERDLVALVRVSLDIAEGVLCDQYWALVPPPAAATAPAPAPSTSTVTATASITLSSSASDRSASAATLGATTQSAKKSAVSMQLLKLVDRDDLLLPGFRYDAAAVAIAAGVEVGEGGRDLPVAGSLPLQLQQESRQEIDAFLQEVLIPSLGAPRPYHPSDYAAGTLNALVS